jgi:hypothetical protein
MYLNEAAVRVGGKDEMTTMTLDENTHDIMKMK